MLWPIPSICNLLILPYVIGSSGQSRGRRRIRERLANGLKRPEGRFFLCVVFVDQALQQLNLMAKLGVTGNQFLDLAHGMQNRGVIATAETATDLGKERGVSILARYMAIWRGLTMTRVRRLDTSSCRDTL